nr:C6 transcription factor [Colletotrichum truncatum]KAF6782990.1 C6 transcription factor [Colletotrichum truncatum]
MPEIGSLRALANGESQFVGSSSGVYFINTVKRAFSSNAKVTAESTQCTETSDARLHNEPSPEDCIVGVEERREGANTTIVNDYDSHTPSTKPPSQITTISDFWDDMRDLPDYSTARKLVLTYFKIWHPLVPFLQGPECLAELKTLYTSEDQDKHDAAFISRLVTFRCIFNISLLDCDDALNIGSVKIRASSDLLPTLSLLALRSDARSIQALLCAQVYFVAVMSLRHASSIGGLISKSIFQSGMHRCPVRYEHLSEDERSMRKRIFWSSYVLDRFVSQSLGHPSGIQDSDIDVCPPGNREFHETVPKLATSPSGSAAENTILHLPANHRGRRAASAEQEDNSRGSSIEAEEDVESQATIHPREESSCDTFTTSAAILRHRRETQAILESHVRHSRLVGRILDVFHKSIHARDMNNQTILYLKADISSWGNNLANPQLNLSPSDIAELTPNPKMFPFITYHYTLLLFNRPSLSLDSRCAEFQAALQACISTANKIITTVEHYSQSGGPLFWPGYMSAVWMSGLVLALAARLKAYKVHKAQAWYSSSPKLACSYGETMAHGT